MSVLRARLVWCLLAVGCFSLALLVHPSSSARLSDRSGSLLALMFGDGRRLFANHFFVKADAYFHKGVYPSIFDTKPRVEELHMVQSGQAEAPGDAHDAEATGGDAHETEGDAHPGEADTHDPTLCDDPTHEHDRVQPPRGDWIAWINQQLTPADHVHLSGGDIREMLPWLRLAAEMDPSNAQNFTITAYWLRTQLGRLDEAEHFLRLGLEHSPGNPPLLFELAVLFLDGRNQPERARNLLEYAWQRWELTELEKEHPDYLLGEGILARLALIEEKQGHLEVAIDWLVKLKPISPRPEAIAEQIAELRAALSAGERASEPSL